MNYRLPTPKTLVESVMNGVAQSYVVTEQLNRRALHHAEIIDLATDTERHVRDFLAQRFGAALLGADDHPVAEGMIMALYESITGKKIK